MEDQVNSQDNIVEHLAFLKKDDNLVPFSDCIDLISDAVRGKMNIEVSAASKLFEYACIQCGRWEAEWSYSSVHSPNKRAKAQADMWEEISNTLYETLVKAVPDPKTAELLDKQRALVTFEPIFKRAVQYSEKNPYEGFLMKAYSRTGLLLSSCGLERIGRYLYERGFYPRGTVGHPNNSKQNYAAELRQNDTGTEHVHFQNCQSCKCVKKIQLATFNENVSMFFSRQERNFSAYVCLPCMTKAYFEYTGKTLVGTWFGIIGMIVGPAYIVQNTFEYLVNMYRFARSR